MGVIQFSSARINLKIMVVCLAVGDTKGGRRIM